MFPTRAEVKNGAQTESVTTCTHLDTMGYFCGLVSEFKLISIAVSNLKRVR